MAAAKQQEEKRVKFLRRMVALPHNRHCFDCGQRGPTYVNMTIGSYVCTACSGILRGINPPHRVKSVSMASFNQEEVDLLTQRGNEYNRQVWLGLHATKEPPQMDTKDEIKLRDYLTQKYERKRWYQAATDLLAEEAKTMNSQTAQNSASSNPVSRRPMVGGFRIQAGTGNAQSISSLPKTIAPPSSALPTTPVSAPVTVTTTHQPLSAQSSNSTSADLLSEVFGSSKSAANGSAASINTEFSQPNFANFSGAQVAPPSPLISTADDKIADTTSPSQEIIDTGTPGMPPASNNQWSSLSAAPPGQDNNKYASLTGLFSDISEPSPAPISVPAAVPTAGLNWNSINWGGATSAQSSNSVLGSSPAGGMSWGTPPTSQPIAQPNNMFHAAQPVPVANAGWGAAAPATGVNPFLGSATASFGAAQPLQQQAFQQQPLQQQPLQQQSFQQHPLQQQQPLQQQPFQQQPLQQQQAHQQQPLQQPFGQTPAATSYPVQQQVFEGAVNVQMSGGYGGFGQTAVNGQLYSAPTAVPNGTANQWGNNQWGASNPAPVASQWGAPSKQTTVNPFLAQTQAPPVQQSTMATNPFL